MIVLDIETSGVNTEKCGIWQIGALELEEPNNHFLEEGRIDDEDLIEEEATKIHGKNEAYLRDPSKQSQKELITNFLRWRESVKIKNCLCHNTHFDIDIIRRKALKYFGKDPFWPNYHRAFDLHTIAQNKYYELYRKFLIKDDQSDMGLTNILKFCGIPDKRKKNMNGKVSEKGTYHNALEDAKLTAECFSRLVYGKPLLSEYAQFPIPEELGGTKR
jgi:DNA polymerase III epsilon subunit-like protein